MSPLMLYVDFNLMGTNEFDRVFSDETFRKTLVFMSSVMNDIDDTTIKRPSKETAHHLQHTLTALNLQLDKSNAHSIASTILVVITLATVAAVFGDWDAVNVHMSGMQKITNLCGGLQFLRKNAKLHYKIERYVYLLRLACHFRTDVKQTRPHVDNEYWPTAFFSSNSYSVECLLSNSPPPPRGHHQDVLRVCIMQRESYHNIPGFAVSLLYHEREFPSTCKMARRRFSDDSQHHPGATIKPDGSQSDI